MYGFARFAIVVAIAVAPSSSLAAVLFSQTPGNINGFATDSAYGVQYVDDFTLSAPSTVERITWRGVYAFSSTPVFPLRFSLILYGNTGNVPDANNVLSSTAITFTSAAQITDTGTLVIGDKLYEFTADITPTALAASTTYWFSPLANTSNDSDDQWYWNSSNAGGTSARRSDSSPFTATANGPFYFILEGTPAPEPAALSLFSLGGIALLGRRRG